MLKDDLIQRVVEVVVGNEVEMGLATPGSD